MQKKSLTFNCRDIVLVELPYSDYTGSKLRPVLIVSGSQFNKNQKDIIVCKITSSNFNDKYHIEFSKSDLDDGALKLNKSWIGSGFLFTIEKSLINKKIGQLSKKKYNEVLNSINLIFNE